MSPAMRSRWEDARRTGEKVKRGRPRKRPDAKSRIEPVSIEPAMLEQVDQYAKTAGISRSRLVAERLRVRIKRWRGRPSEPPATDLTAAIMETWKRGQTWTRTWL